MTTDGRVVQLKVGFRDKLPPAADGRLPLIGWLATAFSVVESTTRGLASAARASCYVPGKGSSRRQRTVLAGIGGIRAACHAITAATNCRAQLRSAENRISRAHCEEAKLTRQSRDTLRFLPFRRRLGKKLASGLSIAASQRRLAR